MYYNESSYYRKNPFYKQGFLPDRAFVNRHLNQHLVELPQGQSHFEPSMRKHFGQSDKSEIVENNLFAHPDEITKPTVAVAKQFQRNLETKDIEGAVTNTLISPVIKNRLRSQQLKQIYQNKNQAPPANPYPNNSRQQQLEQIIKSEQASQMPTPIQTPIEAKRNYHLRGYYDQKEPSEKLEPHRNLQDSLDRIPLQKQSFMERSVDLGDPNSKPRQYQSQQKYPYRQSTQYKHEYNDEIERTKQMNALQVQIEQHKQRKEEPKQDRAESFKTIDQASPIVAPRRINPTFLSFGSNPFNLVAKNIIQQ